MIHYHGTPISGKSHIGAVVLKGRHGFVSFASKSSLPVVAEVCSTFALDNGAFSFWKSGKETDWKAYYEWVELWHKHPSFDFALIPDVIDGCLEDNKRLISEFPFSKFVGTPVWHMHEPICWLYDLCATYPRVAIGSSGEYSTVGNNLWWGRIEKAMDAVTDNNGRPMCKLHGLRMLDPKIFTKLPFSSCDSTNVAVNCADSNRWKNYPPPSNEVRGLVLAERIEAHNSANEWVRPPKQVSLFPYFL